MKFKPINGTLIAACEEAHKFLQIAANMEFIELFSLDGIRTLQQNAKMWPMLTDISKQVEWYGAYHEPEIWKHLLTAAWRNQVFLHGIGGGLVAIPAKTSRLKKAEFAELITCIYDFGDDHKVRWSEPALQTYEQYREAA